jgi:hypothetical protein
VSTCVEERIEGQAAIMSEARDVRLAVVAPKLGAIALIFLLLLLVIPLGISMAIAPCPHCEVGLSLTAICLAMLALWGSLLAPGIVGALRAPVSWRRTLLLTRDLDPPPKAA